MDRQEETQVQDLSFEDRLARVQEIIGKIESGKLPLEDSVTAYEQGMKMLDALDGELKQMNRRLTVLQEGKETGMSHEDL